MTKAYPIRYIPRKFTKKQKLKQKYELNKSRKLYKKGIYYNRKFQPSYKSKTSKHITNAKKIYNIKSLKPSLTLSKKTGCSIQALNKIVNKGMGAMYSSGSRPNQTAQSWAYARLASSITGGKSAAVDYKILENGCKSNSKALKLAKTSKKIHKYGQRKVPKIVI